MTTLTATTEKTEVSTFDRAGITFNLFCEAGTYKAKATRLLKSGRLKTEFFYRFANQKAQLEYVNKAAEKAEAEQTKKQAAKAAIKEASKINPFKVGQILVDSWGYDQTNIDFYQIIEVKGQTVKYKEITCTVVEGSEGFMCCEVLPAKDQFSTRNEAVYTKRVVARGANNYYVNSPLDHWTKLHEGRAHYRSWYA